MAGYVRGPIRLVWPLVIRRLHDALIGNAERATTGRAREPARWSPWVRALRAPRGPRPAAVPVPGAVLAEFGATDLADGWAVQLAPGAPRDAVTWAEAVFADPPSWVRAAMRLREALVGLVGIERGSRDAFLPTAVGDREATFGTDASHLLFQGRVLVGDHTVSVVTLARAHNRTGRLYLAVIRLVHPAVIRAMLRRADLRLTARPSQDTTN